MADDEEEMEGSVAGSHADEFSDKEEEEEKAHRDKASAYLTHCRTKRHCHICHCPTVPRHLVLMRCSWSCGMRGTKT